MEFLLCDVAYGGCTTRGGIHIRHIADDVEDVRQYFRICFVITPVTTPVLPVGRTLKLRTRHAHGAADLCYAPRTLATRARALSIFATDRTSRLLSGSQLTSSSYAEGVEAREPASAQL